MAERFAAHAPARAVEDWAALLQAESFRGRVFRLDFDGDPQATALWLEFVRQYAQASRALPLEQRTVFLAFVRKDSDLRLPAPDLSFVYQPWHGVVQPWDMAAYVASLIDETTLSSMERQLLISTVVELARWDLRLATLLASLPLRELLTPRDTLLQFARDHGWEGRDGWPQCQPFHDTWNELPCWHSAVVALRNDHDETERRLWQAQVAVLFPFLEIQRRQLLEKYRAQLRLPHRRPNGTTVQRHEDLELGDLVHLSRLRAFRPRDPQEVESFGQLRNKLAHLEAAPYYMLQTCLKP